MKEAMHMHTLWQVEMEIKVLFDVYIYVTCMLL